MTNISSFEGLLSVIIVFIISCVHLSRVKALNPYIMTQKFGALSIFHKGAILGTRLKKYVCIIAIILSLYILFR